MKSICWHVCWKNIFRHICALSHICQHICEKNIWGKQIIIFIYVTHMTHTGWAKNGTKYLYTNNFIKYWPIFKIFYWWNQQKICSNINITNPTKPHRCCYTTLWNIRHRTQAGDEMTNCMINVDWAWRVASKQAELKSRRLCCLGAL